MKNDKILVETKNQFNLHDLKNLRQLYLPLIGQNAVMLFQVFFDYHILYSKNSTFFNIDEILKLLSINHMQFEEARCKLEAIGLIRTYEKSDNTTFIVKLNKPLDPNSFRKNSLLYKSNVAKMGEVFFERIEFASKQKEHSKDEYREITTKYQNVFDIPKEDSTNTNTLEIALPSIDSIDDAMANLTFAQFVQFLTSKKISPTQLKNLQKFRTLGFSNYSLNLIINYSYAVNKKIVSNHIKKIAEDLFEKDVYDARSVKEELDLALDSKKSSISVNENKHVKVDENVDQEDWESLFAKLGGGF